MKRIFRYKIQTIRLIIIISILISTVITLLVLDSETSMLNQNYYKYKDFEKIFGSPIYLTIKHKINNDEKETIEPILKKARIVFNFIGNECDADNDVGELKRYYYFNNNKLNISTVSFDLQLVTANIKKDKGSIWLKYSVVRYDKEGNIVNGSIDILSYWKIKKNDDDWKVVEIIEQP